MGDTFRIRTNGKANGLKNAVPRGGIVAALDVGSAKVACIIARAEQGGLRVLGSALRESRGIKSGTVISIDQAEQSIGETVEAAEELADHRIQDVILSVQCGHPKSLYAKAEAAGSSVLVSDNHLRMLLADAKRRCTESGYEAIQAAPTEYVVDQTRGVSDPRDMVCARLGASAPPRAVGRVPRPSL